MLLNSPSIILCPECGAKFSKMNVASGNTFGAIFWSDGSFLAPHLPQIPWFAKCSQCRTIFNVNNAEVFHDGEFPESMGAVDVDALPEVSPLSFDCIIRALSENVIKTREEEIYLRTKLWQNMNYHPMRGEMAVEHANSPEYRQNASILLNLLDDEDENNRLTKAELYRNLGEFDQCAAILKTISSHSLKHTVSAIKDACKHHRRGTLHIE